MNKAFSNLIHNVFPLPEHIPATLSELHAQKNKPHITFYKAVMIFSLTLLLLSVTVCGYAIGKTLLEERKRWEAEKGPMGSWRLEDKALFSSENQILNTDWQNPRYRIPADNEITKEQAKVIAVQALKDTYSITEEDLSAWDFQESLEYTDPDFPEDGCFYHFLWINHTKNAIHPGGDLYEVYIDPLSGEIISIQSSDDMAG